MAASTVPESVGILSCLFISVTSRQSSWYVGTCHPVTSKRRKILETRISFCSYLAAAPAWASGIESIWEYLTGQCHSVGKWAREESRLTLLTSNKTHKIPENSAASLATREVCMWQASSPGITQVWDATLSCLLKFRNWQVKGWWVCCMVGWGRKALLTCRRCFLSGILLNSKQIWKARRRTWSCFCIRFMLKDLHLRWKLWPTRLKSTHILYFKV